MIASRRLSGLPREKNFRWIWIDGFIAQLSHEGHQMRRHPNGLLAQTNDKSFTDFPAERRVVDVADLNVTLVDHEISNLLIGQERKTLSGERSQGELLGFSRPNPIFANRRRRNPARPVLSNSRQPR